MMPAPPPSDVSTPRSKRPAGSVDLDNLWRKYGPDRCLVLVGRLWRRREVIRREAMREGKEDNHIGPSDALMAWLNSDHPSAFSREWGLRWQPDSTWLLAQLIVGGQGNTPEAFDAFQDAVEEVKLPENEVRAVVRARFGFEVRLFKRTGEHFGPRQGLHFWAADADGSVVHGPTLPMDPEADWFDVKRAGENFEDALKAGEAVYRYLGRVCD